MNNETPTYADWVPEAGGYVANGNVVSKSPIYDDSGKLKLNVDASLFQQAPASQNAQVANTPTGNVGVTTANVAGSKEDANAPVTNIGSNVSLDLNTANPNESVVSSPATKSPSAGETILSPTDKVNKDYQDAAARGDYQGMINALVEMQNLTGQDYSAQISSLTKQRQQKIMDIDDQYLAKRTQLNDAYKQAVKSGDVETAKQIVQYLNQMDDQQEAWRSQVGYQDAMRAREQEAMQDLEVDYETTYLDGINNQIVPALTQLVSSYLNFQYDPSTDSALLRAQAQTEMRMRNQAAATGMYNSSTTQYAIAQALGELVPVYEKMAKEEIMNNISLLQNTASFLMDLEQTQFNMWKSQIQLQLDANEEKRKQIQAAIDTSNARGYFNNEEAALLGVEPGSLSQKAREHEQELQETIEAEQRKLQQDIILAGYKSSLEIQKMQQEYALKDQLNANEAQRQLVRDYNNNVWDYQIASLSNGGSSTPAPTYEISYTDPETGKEVKIKGTATQDAMGNYVDPLGNIIGSTGTTTNSGSAVWNSVASKYGADTAKTIQALYDDAYSVKNLDFSDASAVKNFSKGFTSDVTKQLATEKANNINALKDYINPNSPNSSKNLVGPSKLPEVNTLPYLESTYLQKAKDVVAEASSNFSDNEATTQKAIGKATQSITNMLKDLSNQGMSKKEVTTNAELMLLELFEAIENSDASFDFDRNVGVMQDWANNGVVNISGVAEGLDASMSVFNQGDKAKEDAMVSIIYDVVNSKEVPADMKKEIATVLSQRAYDFANKEGVNGYAGLKKKSYWNYLKQ